MDIERYDCAYCGMMAQSRDHVVPVSFTAVSRMNATWDKSEIVPACQECNSLLSNRWLPTISERAAFLCKKLATRHQKKLQFPSWDEKELVGVSKRMRKQILARMNLRDLLKARIDFAESIANSSLVPKDCW
jgi:NMD protein affecting ribosome stability and mRNA decay